MPYVSVVVPAYNAAGFIADAYRSVVDQTIDDWEIIFVNDASQDNTLAVLQSFVAADKRVKVIDLKSNSGPAHARNAAVAVAEGYWIAVLDADDRYSPDRLEVLTKAGEQSQADVVMDNQFVVDPISKRVTSLGFEPTSGKAAILKFADFLRNTQSSTLFDFGYLKPVIRRRWMATNHIHYDEKLRLGEDLMFFLECYACGARVILVSKPYYYYYAQYSLVSRRKSPTTNTEANYGPLLAAIDEFIDKHGSKQPEPEQWLLNSTRESLREAVLVKVLKARVKHFDLTGLRSCLRHPIRLVRGIYFEKRRGILLRLQGKKREQSRGDQQF
ncbi:MAG: glycosyltransferase family 2 protein [Xanthobacteraceae bacterium]